MNIQSWVSWINNNGSYIEVAVFLVFLMIASNKNNYKRFITVILDCIAAAGHMVLNFSESLLGVLSSVEDFFEALTYVLFGNFSSAIRFIMANYIVLFASIVSFLTTLWGLEKILDWRLAIVLSFAIQMVLVLMSLYLAQQFWGEPVRWKRVVEYYSEDCSPTNDVPHMSSDVQGEKGSSQINLYTFKKMAPCLVITIFLVTISSMLTYVYLYDTVLDDYMVYKAAYALMDEVEKDTAENIENLDNYYKCARVILNSYWETANKDGNVGNSLNEIFDYLDGRPFDGVDKNATNNQKTEKAEEIYQNFVEYVRGIKETSSNKNSVSDNDTGAVWDQSHVQSAECVSKDDVIFLVRNILDLKLYSSRELGNVETLLEDLRKYFVKVDTQSESGLQEEKKKDKRAIREKVQEIILYENELYSNVPILQDIQVRVSVNGERKIQNWIKPIKRGYAAKYEHYLEIADARLLVVGRAFDALFNMHNIFLWCMFGLSFIADFLVLVSCFVRAKQEAGKSNRIKQNLIHNIFIKGQPENSPYDDFTNIVFLAVSGISIIGLFCVKYVFAISDDQKSRYINIMAVLWMLGFIFKAIFPDVMMCITKQNHNSTNEGMLQQVLTNCGCEILEHIERKKVLKEIFISRKGQNKEESISEGCQSSNSEEQRESVMCQEFFVDWNSICEGGFKKEVMLMCSEELAYQVTNNAKEVKGYVITKECVRLLIKEIFDAAKRNGLDIRMFKEDLKEYEEDVWN